ncbi:MAG: hypothetical protein IKS20_10275, partial [Victivallales bacterium]|nr:hypothetical protein [Victivallales bacterium]
MKQTALLLTSCICLLSCLCSAGIMPIYYKQDPGIVIDGILSQEDWKEIGSVFNFPDAKQKKLDLTTGVKWNGKSDISGSAKVAYRQDGMYFAFNVHDDIHCQKSMGADCFKGDHVEVVIDLQPAVDKDNAKFGPSQIHVAFSPGSLDGKLRPEAFMYHPVRRNLTVPVRATGSKDGYQLEAM